jgi:hypothetical protein
LGVNFPPDTEPPLPAGRSRQELIATLESTLQQWKEEPALDDLPAEKREAILTLARQAADTLGSMIEKLKREQDADAGAGADGQQR